MKLFVCTLAAIAGLLFYASCKSQNPTTDTSQLKPLMEMYKGPCFGYCPVFRLRVYNNRLAEFKGRANVGKLGRHLRFVSKKEFKNLHKAFQKAALWQYDDHYPSNISDLPKVTIQYWEGERHKQIMGDINRPEAIIRLERQLDSIAFKGEWMSETNDSVEMQVIKDQLLIKFKKGSDIPVWVERFAKNNVQLIERIEENDLRWLIRYDSSTIEPEQMLKTVLATDEIAEAQFHKVPKPNPEN